MGKPRGRRQSFVRPVFEISPLTSLLGHYTQQLYQGLATEHWQILAYGVNETIINPSPTEPWAGEVEHALLYTCLDAKIGKTFCLHIISKNMKVPESVVRQYIELAKQWGIYREDDWRPVVHDSHCIYDPVEDEGAFTFQ